MADSAVYKGKEAPVLVVTPNTCIDVTTWLPSLVPGSVSRATRTEVTAGGKDVNVCRTLRALGDSPRLIGLSAASDARLADLLAAEGCDFLPMHHGGQTRLALIRFEDAGRVTPVKGMLDATLVEGLLHRTAHGVQA